MRRLLISLSLLLASCTAGLPDVPLEAFACEGDARDPEGLLPCPETHWCVDKVCTPRLDCFEPQSEVPGCTEDVHRCDLAYSSEVAAVHCVPGLHTIKTSTLPRDPALCDCPDGTFCTTIATLDRSLAPSARPLFVIAKERVPAVLPVGSYGITGENTVGRICVRVCGSELDCPGNHTCRPAPVLVQPNGPDGSRHTIGVCYPDVLPTTATVAQQPDPNACQTEGDCTAAVGRFDGLCQARVVDIPDHPTVPAANAWVARRAIVASCVADVLGNLRADGAGCVEGSDCQSGICLATRCAKLCDPLHPACPSARRCRESPVQRKVPTGETILDRLHLCET